MIILIDNYDSFTFNVYHYLSEVGANVKVFRNDKITIDEVLRLNPQGIVLSPGPKTPNEAGICLELIKKSNNIPILGICLGHQSIGQAFGGSIIQCDEIIHGKIDTIKHYGHKIFQGVNVNFQATRYHSLIVDKKNLPNELEIIAKTKDEVIMALAHKSKKIFGVQFHPESIGTKVGKIILENFIKIIKNEYQYN